MVCLRYFSSQASGFNILIYIYLANIKCKNKRKNVIQSFLRCLNLLKLKKKNLERSHSFAFFCDSDFAFNILNQRLFFVCVVHFSWENMLFSQSAFRESARLKSFCYQNRFYLHALNVTFMLHIVPECGANACSLFFFHFQYYCFFKANHPPCMRASLRGHFSGLCAVVSSASVRGK